MKALLPISSLFLASVSHAHEALVPHLHPHETSMLPGINVIGVTALALAVGVIALTYLKRG